MSYVSNMYTCSISKNIFESALIGIVHMCFMCGSHSKSIKGRPTTLSTNVFLKAEGDKMKVMDAMERGTFAGDLSPLYQHQHGSW